jgi:hypothetical protein
VTKLLKTNPQERISLEEVLEHPWFQGNPPVKPATAVVAPPTEPTKLPLDSDIIKKENYQVVSKPSIANKAEV